MESLSHATLKRLAAEFLLRVGCCASATEVMCPIARHRVDAAGYADDSVELPRCGERALATLWSLEAARSGGARPRSTRKTPSTVIIECKRSRADFFRDGEDVDSLLAARDRLRARRAEIEESHVKRLEPHLRRSGTALFPELESWDFASSRLGGYRRALRELRAVDRRLYGHTKFSRLVKYRLADHLLVLSPSGLLRPADLPEGWGLLECPRLHLRRGALAAVDDLGPLDDLPLRLTVDSPAHASPIARRQRLLRNIAVALTRRRAHAGDVSVEAASVRNLPSPSVRSSGANS